LTTLLTSNSYSELKIDFIAPENSDNKPEKINNSIIQKSDTLKFKNGDILHGSLLSVNSKGISWSSREAAETIIFKKRSVTNILLGTQKSYSKTANTQILLTNGDMLAGKLIKLDDKSLSLGTEYAGELAIDKFMIQAIYPGIGGGNNAFKGPNSIDEWIVEDNGNNGSSVTVKEGVLTISGYTAVGRNMKLPDSSKIEFDIESLGNCQFQIQIYGSKVKRNPQNGYTIFVSSGYIYLQRYGDGDSDNLGNFRSRELQSGKGKITILADKIKKKIILMINGKIAKQWSDTEWAGNGEYVTFINQSNTTVKVKNIVAGGWNGKLPEAKSSKKETQHDSIAFINDDIVSGKLLSIENEKVRFKTEYAEMDIPIARVKEIITASGSRHRARRRGNDIRCYFEDGASITLDLKSIEKGVIEGRTGNFGNAKIKLNAFGRVQFNIYDSNDD
jgi:hypothetical protein